MSSTPSISNVSTNASSSEASPEKRDGYQWTALSVTTVGALLASIQGSALLIALPKILADLQATFLTIMWVLLGYLLVLTVLTPIIGRLADLFGRKRLYNSGFIAFTVGSLLAGLVQPQFHGADLIVARMIQGVGASLLITNSTVIVTDAFRKGQIGLGLGINQIAGAAGFLIGPIVGGLLTELSWRWVFLFNVPIGLFGVVWGIWRLREPVRAPERHQIDWFGTIFLTAGLTGLLLGLSLSAFPLLPQSITDTILIAGIVCLALFLIIEPRIKVPLIQLRFFRNRLFALANLTGLLNGIARGAVLFLMIFFLQGPYGKDPLTAGLMLTPFGAAFMLVGPISGRLSDRIGSRILASVGLGISTIALLALTTIDQNIPYWQLAIYMAIMGGASGLFASPNTNAIMSSVESHSRGAAAGVLNMLNNTGQMLSIAIVFPLALSKLPFGAIQQVFITGGGMGRFATIIPIFLSGLHQAFLVSFVLSVIATIVSALRPAHGTRLLGEEAA